MLHSNLEQSASCPGWFATTLLPVLQRTRGYPEEFVAALTEAGYLAVLIPEEFGGAGLGVGPRRVRFPAFPRTAQ